MNSIGIVIVCYNRLESLKRLIKSLELADYGTYKPTLIFSIDFSGSDCVSNFAENYEWKYGEKVVLAYEQNLGLKKHILKCGDLTEKYDVLIVLEDDIFVSSSFLNYAVEASNFYGDDDNVAGISLYSFQKNWLKWDLRFEPIRSQYDTFFMKIAQSWGQVWTYKKWTDFMKWYQQNQVFDKDDSIPQYLHTWPSTSWLKYHTKYCILNNKYFVYPYVSMSTNFSDKGTHAKNNSTDHQVEMPLIKRNFMFPMFTQESIRYDEYMNLENLKDNIDFPFREITIDLWGTRNSSNKTKYLLTTKKCNFLIVKSYPIQLRPIELNILYNMEGEGIYLYNTHVKYKNKFVESTNLNIYSFRTSHWRIYLKTLGISFISYIKNKLR